MHFVNKVESIKNDILGKKYSLSVAYVTERKSREINKKYRKVDKPTNVLAFPLRKNEGELVLCRDVIKKEAKNLDRAFQDWLYFLVIHGMLHLKGMKHSSTMDKAEKKYYKKYNKKYDQKHFHRNRRGVIHDQSGGRRVSQRRKKP